MISERLVVVEGWESMARSLQIPKGEVALMRPAFVLNKNQVSSEPVKNFMSVNSLFLLLFLFSRGLCSCELKRHKGLTPCNQGAH
jgi:hypothetical protein